MRPQLKALPGSLEGAEVADRDSAAKCLPVVGVLQMPLPALSQNSPSPTALAGRGHFLPNNPGQSNHKEGAQLGSPEICPESCREESPRRCRQGHGQ